MIKYGTLEKNVKGIVKLIGEKSDDPLVKSFSKNSQFYIIINPKLTKSALARTIFIYNPNPKYVQQGDLDFHYVRPGGVDKVFKINSKTSWVFRIEFSQMFLKHANWTDIKAVITHELSHDFDFYSHNGRSHHHQQVFINILTEFRKLVGVRSNKTKGFAREESHKSWLNEIQKQEYEKMVKRDKKEEFDNVKAYFLTKIYDMWYPQAEKDNTINFDNFWDFTMNYFRNRNYKREMENILSKMNRNSISISRTVAYYWYMSSKRVDTLPFNK